MDFHRVTLQDRGWIEQLLRYSDYNSCEYSFSSIFNWSQVHQTEVARVEDFGRRFDEDFGAGAALPPKNLVDTKHLELRCPDVTIQVSPERGDLVETRVIDGVRYILIRAEEGVQVNGVEVHIARDE